MTTEKNDLWTIVTPVEEVVLKVLHVKDISPEPEPGPPDFPVVWQRKSLWANLLLGDLDRGLTIGNAGCALCCLTAWLTWTCGWYVSVLAVRELLHGSRLLLGGDHTMMQWSRLHRVWGEATWDTGCRQNWSRVPANLVLLDQWLHYGPVIVEVDFKTASARVDQHFVVAIGWTEPDRALANRGLWVMDPWEGAIVQLPPAYYNEAWDTSPVVEDHGKVARILTGARAIGHAGELP